MQSLLGTHTIRLRGESMEDGKGVTEEGTGAIAAGKGVWKTGRLGINKEAALRKSAGTGRKLQRGKSVKTK